MDKDTKISECELRALGRALRYLRKQAGLTQWQLATRAGLLDTYISEVEGGRRSVRWITVLRLLRALDADLRQLVDAIDAAEREKPSAEHS
jgi:transcriptional regulator with XRE-family HTH domain